MTGVNQTSQVWTNICPPRKQVWTDLISFIDDFFFHFRVWIITNLLMTIAGDWSGSFLVPGSEWVRHGHLLHLSSMHYVIWGSLF